MKAQYLQYSTAASGTVTFADTGDSVQLVHEAALAATLTIAFPANPVDGQVVRGLSVGGVTTLTLSASVGTIISALTTLVAGGTFAYTYSGANSKWYKTN